MSTKEWFYFSLAAFATYTIGFGFGYWRGGADEQHRAVACHKDFRSDRNETDSLFTVYMFPDCKPYFRAARQP